MKILPGGCWVVPGGSEYREEGTRGYRIPISREMGAHEIFQTVSLYDLGRAPSRRNPFAEEVLYVVRGFGACRIDEFAYPLRPQTAVYIPPGSVYQVQTSTDLTGWTNLGVARFAAGTTDSIYLGLANKGYYRITRLVY